MPYIDPDDMAMAVDDDLGEGTELFGCDTTERGHRLRLVRHDEGVEIVVMHGPKCGCGDTKGPVDTFLLSDKQCEVVVAMTIRQKHFVRATAALAARMRDGETDPELLAATVLSDLIMVDYDTIVSAIAESRAELAQRNLRK
jgi:hypothetical protein